MHRLLRRLLSPLVLAIALGLTWLLWQHERQSLVRDQQASLDFALRTNVSRIQQAMATYQQMLRGVQGLFAASKQVEPEAFHAYVEALQLNADLSGIDGVSAIAIVPSAGRSTHVAAMRQRGFADYQIWPPGERLLYAPLVQLEPSSPSRMAMRGFDPYADPQRREAMELARDVNMPSITGKLEIKASGTHEPGFVMYLPLYRHDAPHDTLASRRANLVGWVSAPFRINKLMASLYGERRHGIRIRIFDGVDLAQHNLLYSSATTDEPDSDVERLEYIEVAGRTWTLAIGTSAATGALLTRNRARMIGLAGISLSLLLALLTWVLVSGRERAFALASNMTAALRASEARYRHLAQHDTLTNLPNLPLFSDRLQQALILAKRNHQQLAVLFLDLDQFKPINDALGHHMGNLLLQAVAKRLHDCVRASDTVARIGGDEFVLLLPVINGLPEALALARTICSQLSQPFEMADGQRLNISSSIGVAVYPEHGSDDAQLLRHADQAMYDAKRRGRNQVCWHGADRVA